MSACTRYASGVNFFIFSHMSVTIWDISLTLWNFVLSCVVIEAGEPYQFNKRSNHLRLFEFRTPVFLFCFPLLFYSCLNVFFLNFTFSIGLSCGGSLYFNLPIRTVIQCFPSFWICTVGLLFGVSFHFDLPSRIEIQCYPSF